MTLSLLDHFTFKKGLLETRSFVAKCGPRQTNLRLQPIDKTSRVEDDHDKVGNVLKKQTNMDSEMAASSERHNKLDLEASKKE